MSLGLFNCRLIQPAGDQLFFFSAVLPRRCQFGQALFSLLVTRPARPRPTGGRRMLLVFPSQKDSFLVFRGAKSRRAQKGSLPPIHPRIPPKIPQSYPQIPLQTLIEHVRPKKCRLTWEEQESHSNKAVSCRFCKNRKGGWDPAEKNDSELGLEPDECRVELIRRSKEY